MSMQPFFFYHISANQGLLGGLSRIRREV